MYGPKKKDIAGCWITVHKEEILDIYSSPHIIQVMRSREMRWTQLVAFMGQKISSESFGGGNQEERGHFANLGVEGTIRWSLQKQDVTVWTGLIWLSVG